MRFIQMSEIISTSILGLLLIAMFIYHIVVIKEYNKQIIELNKMLKAKDLTEYVISENIKEEEKEVIPPEFVSADNISDDVFDRMIARQRGDIENAA